MGKKQYFPSLVSLVLLIIESLILCFAKNSSLGCIEQDRKALLKFKTSLVDTFDRLSSWKDGEANCCIWEGVSCNEITRHVISLDLGTNEDDDDDQWLLESNRLDSSILELKHLNYLDLSGNNFRGSTIPTFLGSMEELQYLNLSRGFFGGNVPHHLGNLSNLRVLDLHDLPIGGGLSVDDLTWVSTLSLLEYLDLNWVDLSRIKDLVKVLNTFPSLVTLSLSNTKLTNEYDHISRAWVNLTLFSSVQHLEFSGNSFYSNEFPSFLQNMTSLTFVDLSRNGYTTSDPHFLTSKNLVHVDLSWNSLGLDTNWLSQFMRDKCHLKSLNLKLSQLHGEMSVVFNNLSGCWSRNLETLSLGHNMLSGSIPSSVGNLSALRVLDLSNPISLPHLPKNNLSGSIPSSIGNLEALEVLDISSNSLSGPIPPSIGNLKELREFNIHSNQLNGEITICLGNLSNLEKIDISDNSFNGTVSEAHFATLSNLKNLSVDSNSIQFRFQPDWVPPFQLKQLDMRSSDVGGQFPQWLRTQKALPSLDLSNCSISGTFPEFLGTMNLYKLYLPNNRISGTIPQLPSTLSTLDLSNNMVSHIPSNIGNTLPNLGVLLLGGNSINGSIPNSLCRLKSLSKLDLSRNSFSGNLLDCWQNFPELEYLRLSSNKFSGTIPESMGHAYKLLFLMLDNNSFEGQLPATLEKCTSLSVLTAGGNMLSGKIPEWIGGHLLDLRILVLRNNLFHGVIPPVLCHSSELQIIDLGNNSLIGSIPHCFQNFSHMIHDVYVAPTFEVDHDSFIQVFKGLQLEYFKGSHYELNNVDLSCNNLTGEIPSELTSLVYLRGLNLSFNHLKGEIPITIGMMNTLESLDLSNNNLVGRIPNSLSNLTFLGYLNLSNNDLSGQIPTGPQLQTLDNPSIYGGNPHLCGAPLLKKCYNDEAPKGSDTENHAETRNEEDTLDKILLSAFVVGGFVTGLWGFIGVLVFNQKWRRAYFHFAEAVVEKMVGH